MQAAATSPDRTDWPLILLMWLAGLGTAGQYAKISVIYDQLPEIYPHAGSALGFAVSLVGTVGIALGVVAGLLVGRIGPRRAVLAGLTLGAALSFAQAPFPPLPVFLALRVLEGAAHLALVVALPTLIAQVATERDRGLALSLWSTFFAVAFTLLTWIGLPFAARAGLGALIAAHGGVMAIMALVLARRLPVVMAAPQPVRLAELLAVHARIYSDPAISAPALGWLFYTLAFLAVLTVIPPYLPEDMRALTLGAMPLMSIAASLTLGVWLMNRLGPVTVVILGFVLCALISVALWAAPGAPVLALALGAALGLVQGGSFAAVPVLTETPDTRALANGGLAQMGNLGNTLGTPVMATVLLGMGYGGLMGVLAVTFGLGAATHLALAASRRRHSAQKRL
ncbi:MAG: MFS transporter [Pseudomonadota bacterium]